MRNKQRMEGRKDVEVVMRRVVQELRDRGTDDTAAEQPPYPPCCSSSYRTEVVSNIVVCVDVGFYCLPTDDTQQRQQRLENHFVTWFDAASTTVVCPITPAFFLTYSAGTFAASLLDPDSACRRRSDEWVMTDNDDDGELSPTPTEQDDQVTDGDEFLNK